MTDSDFASVTDSGRLCDAAGNLGAAEFEAAMRGQLRRFAQRRLADALVRCGDGHVEFAHLAALKLLALDGADAGGGGGGGGGGGTNLSARPSAAAGSTAGNFLRRTSGGGAIARALASGCGANNAAGQRGGWEAALQNQLAELRAELAAARSDTAELRSEMAAVRADVQREAGTLLAELRGLAGCTGRPPAQSLGAAGGDQVGGVGAGGCGARAGHEQEECERALREDAGDTPRPLSPPNGI